MSTISVEAISAVFTGMIGLLTALAAILAGRSRRIGEDSRAIKRGARLLQKKFIAAMDHIFTLEQDLAERGIPVRARPEILESDDDDDGPTPAPARANAQA